MEITLDLTNKLCPMGDHGNMVATQSDYLIFAWDRGKGAPISRDFVRVCRCNTCGYVALFSAKDIIV